MSFRIKENLELNNSITFHKDAKDWKEGIWLSIKPLIDNKVCDKSYYDSIIESTIKFGPYYLLCPNVVMPHGEMGKGVFSNGITLSVFEKPVEFPKDVKAQIFMCLCGKDSTVHTVEALPQIAALFENEENIVKILKSKTSKEILDFLSNVDLSKYLDN
ncbi:MAG: PTS sugar transporter subunit IIA [Malacoplasma sp.]